MKKAFFTGSTILALALSATAAEDLTTQLALQTDCKAVSEIVSAALDGKATDTAAIAGILETAIKAKASCACEIVTATIEATGAAAKDKAALIEVIVETAVRAAPEKAATIAECALEAAPDHAEVIDKTLTRIFEESDSDYLGEGKSEKQGYGKEKKVAEEEEEEDDDLRGTIGAVLPAPVYLIAPSGGIIGSGDILHPPVTPANPYIE